MTRRRAGPVRGADAIAIAHTRVFLRRWVAQTAALLEVGCGTGEVSARLAASGVVVTAIDPDEEAVRAARARGVAARVGRAEALSGGPYAAVAFTRSLHHAASLAAALEGARRVLEDGALLLVEELAVEEAGPAEAAWRYGAAERDPLARWREEHGREPIHGGAEMMREVKARFDVLEVRRVPYLYRYAAGDGGRSAGEVARRFCEERRLVREGKLRAIGLRIVGVNR